MKKLLSLILVAIMLVTAMPMAFAEGNTYKVGDIVQFGSYPQSKVTDSTTISALNSAGGEWISYNYYSGTGSPSDGKMTASDYMRYKDVIYGSDKYRGVVFDSYRPCYTGYTSSSSYTYQDENGFFTNTVYWFKYEPIMWRVLDPVTGMVMSESILDSQPYNNYVLSSGTDKYGHTACWGDSSKTYYANNYAESSLRQWLNNDFYNTAFSKAQQDIIKSTTLDNSANSDSYSEYDSASTKDKIFLLSYNEVRNSNFGFNSSSSASDTARRAQGSDYAQSQGLHVYSSGSTYNGNSAWLLRSPGLRSNDCWTVYINGYSTYNYHVYDTRTGVRPALRFNLSSEIVNPEHTCSYSSVVTASTCTTQGYTTYTCECGDTYKADYVNKNGHKYESEITTPATHLTKGVKTYTCHCGYSYTESIPKLTAHTYKEVVTNPTCTDKGYTTYTCECGDSYVDNYVDTVNHKDENKDYKCDYGCGNEFEKPAPEVPNEPTTPEEPEKELTFFEKIAKWFKDLFAKLFGWLK